MAIGDVSLAEDSGWHTADQARAAELTQIFEGGQYGMNLLKKASLLQHAGQRLTCKDSAFKLADGKHTFQALSEIKKKYDSLAEEQQAELGYADQLIQALTVGVDVCVIEFPEWDDDVTFAWAVTVHDVESNRYKATTLADMVSVVMRYRQRVSGGSWGGTQTCWRTSTGSPAECSCFAW